MERRLIPVNALLALSTPGDVYPAPLAAVGYRVTGIEVPVAAGDGKVAIDVVLFRADSNMIIAGEAKSGSNVEEAQARRYKDLEADNVVVASAITITAPGDRHLERVYVCLAENVDRVLLGLGKAGLACPVLAVGDTTIERYGAPFADADLEAAFSTPVAVSGPPPRLVVVDDQSPDTAFDALVLPALVAQISNRRPEVSIPTLAEVVIPHLAIFGKAARGRLVRKVDVAARRVADQDPISFEYHPQTGTHDAFVRLLRAPEAAARQGRTQVYQSIARAAGKRIRSRRPLDPDQMALFDDLIDELERADDTVEADDTASEDEVE